MSPVPERPISVLPDGIDTSGVFILGSFVCSEISGGPVEMPLFGPSMSKSGAVVLKLKSFVSSCPWKSGAEALMSILLGFSISSDPSGPLRL